MEKLNGKYIGLRKADERDLLIRVSRFIAKKLIYLNDVEDWKDTEISKAINVPQNRLSEIKKIDKYNRPVTKKHLALIIEGGIVTTSDLKQHVATNEDEVKYISDFEIYEDEKTIEEYKLLKEAGFNPAKILAEFRAKNVK